MKTLKTKEELEKLSKEELIKLVLELQKGKQEKQRKPNTPPNWSKFHFRHVALKIAYVGWDYLGLASQPGTTNTIEGKLFEALEKLMLIKDRKTCNYSRCGRTDKGVSALGQVVAFHLRSNLDSGLGVIPNDEDLQFDQKPKKKQKKVEEIDYVAKINSVLPPDIRVLAWAPVPEHFNARFGCMYRTYKYFFIKQDYDIPLMQEAGKKLIGEHDWRNFCKINPSEEKINFKRRILNVEIQKSELFHQSVQDEFYDVYEIIITGHAFLWHQVRCMVAILFLIGQHKENIDIIDKLLNVEECKSRPQYSMAPEYPLVLYECGFEELEWQYSNRQQWRLKDHCFDMWSKSILKTALWTIISQQANIKHDKSVKPKEKYKPIMQKQRSLSYDEIQERKQKKKQKKKFIS